MYVFVLCHRKAEYTFAQLDHERWRAMLCSPDSTCDLTVLTKPRRIYLSPYYYMLQPFAGYWDAYWGAQNSVRFQTYGGEGQEVVHSLEGWANWSKRLRMHMPIPYGGSAQ